MRISDWSSDVCSSDLTTYCSSTKSRSARRARSTRRRSAPGWRDISCLLKSHADAKPCVRHAGLDPASAAWTPDQVRGDDCGVHQQRSGETMMDPNGIEGLDAQFSGSVSPPAPRIQAGGHP